MRRFALALLLATSCFRNDQARTILASPTARFPLTWQELDENPDAYKGTRREIPSVKDDEKARAAVQQAVETTAQVERQKQLRTKYFDEDDVRIALNPVEIRDTSSGKTACGTTYPGVVSSGQIGVELGATLRARGFRMAGADNRKASVLELTPISDVRSCHAGHVSWQLMLEVRHNGQLLTTAYAGPASSIRGDLYGAAASAVHVMHSDERLIAFTNGDTIPTLISEPGGLFGKRQDPVVAAAPAEPLQLTAPLSMLVLPLKPTGDVSDSTCDLLTNYMLSTFYQVRDLRSVSKDDIETTLNVDKQRQALGCDAIACMVEIGGALGVDVVAYGQVGIIGSKHNINVSVVRSSDSHVVARASVIVDDSDGLTSSIPLLVNQLVERLNSGR